MNIDPSVMENINAIWATPYGMAAKWVFILGVVFMFVLMVTRHKMSTFDAVLAIVGIKPVLNRDIWFNLLHIGVIVLPLLLLIVSMQIVNN